MSDQQCTIIYNIAKRHKGHEKIRSNPWKLAENVCILHKKIDTLSIQTYSSFPIMHKIGKVGIFVLLKI